jgi:cAMP-dependent protein kinase regulator
MASLEDVAARARRLEVEAGTEVIRYGEEGDDFYVIADGEAEVLLLGFRVARLTAGAGFGEQALLRSTTRAATVRALTPLTLFVVDRISFLCAATNQPPEALDGIQAAPATIASDLATRPLAEVLADVPLLRELDDGSLERLAEGATIEDWQPGAVVIREGDSGADMFVILAGRARTIIHGEHDRELLPGDAFRRDRGHPRRPANGHRRGVRAAAYFRLAIDALTEIIAAHGSSA